MELLDHFIITGKEIKKGNINAFQETFPSIPAPVLDGTKNPVR